MLRAVQVAHTTDKMITKKVKARWSPLQKSWLPSSDLGGMWECILFTLHSWGLIALEEAHILDEGVRTHLGKSSQGQVKDQCLSLIYYLWWCVLGLRVTLCVIEHPLVLSTCEIGSTPINLQVKWFPWLNMQKRSLSLLCSVNLCAKGFDNEVLWWKCYLESNVTLQVGRLAVH